MLDQTSHQVQFSMINESRVLAAPSHMYVLRSTCDARYVTHSLLPTLCAFVCNVLENNS
jgi:hypothetical protein